MRKIIIIAAVFMGLTTIVDAQEEYRISQPISDSIDDLEIGSGWKVRIRHGDASSITIVTPCSVFFDEENEPQISTIEGRKLTLLSNTTMPKSTIVEITLKHQLFCIAFEEGATAETEDLQFYRKESDVFIRKGAKVKGKTWKGRKNLDVDVDFDATLQLDTLQTGGELVLKRAAGATVECPVLISSDTKVKSDTKSFGTPYETDASKNLSVKKRNLNWTRHVQGIGLSAGISSGIPLYINNKNNSPYSRGEEYRISIYTNFLKPFQLTNKFTFKPWLGYEWGWSRMLNHVEYDGNALVMSTPTSGELPQQHLLTQNLGLKLQFNYSFGKTYEGQENKPLYISFGVDAMRNIGGRLITRTMGSDNHWDRTRDKVDVMNPWQLRAFLTVGSAMMGGSVGLTYDLLPTYRSGTDADKIHTFGVTLNF